MVATDFGEEAYLRIVAFDQVASYLPLNFMFQLQFSRNMKDLTILSINIGNLSSVLGPRLCSLFKSAKLWPRVTYLRFLSRWDFPCLRCYSNSPLGDPDFKCPDADPEILAKSDSDMSVTPCARVWGPSSGNSNQPSAV